MVYVTGDWHGGGASNHCRLSAGSWPEGQELTKDDYLVILGDFGLVWTGGTRERQELAWLDRQPWTTLFIDGNHEGFSLMGRLPVEEWHGGATSPIPGTDIRWLRRGQVFDLCGLTLFTMGGAWSIDAKYRTPGVDWFPEELPSEAELAEGERNLDRVGWRVDHVLTHDCPLRYLPRMTRDSPFGNVSHVDALELWLDEVDDRCEFKHWWFGHHHVDRDLDDRHSCIMERVIRLD